MSIKIKEITYNVGGDPVSDQDLTLAEYTDRIIKHTKGNHAIKLLENNRTYVKGKFSEYMYFPCSKKQKEGETMTNKIIKCCKCGNHFKIGNTNGLPNGIGFQLDNGKLVNVCQKCITELGTLSEAERTEWFNELKK